MLIYLLFFLLFIKNKLLTIQSTPTSVKYIKNKLLGICLKNLSNFAVVNVC